MKPPEITSEQAGTDETKPQGVWKEPVDIAELSNADEKLYLAMMQSEKSKAKIQ